MQVVVITNPRAPIVSQTVFYKVGAMDDPQGKSGMAHFLEHLMFKGASDVPAGEFMEAIASLGGEQNAVTTRDFTYYFQHVPKEQLEKTIKLEAGRMSSLTILADHVETERSVVLQERRMRIDNNPAAVLQEATSKTFYWHHAYGRPAIGWEHEIANYSLKDAQDFYQKWYKPNNAVLVFSGDITVEEVRPLVEKYYGKIPSGKLPDREENIEPTHRGIAQRTILKSPLVDHPKFNRLYPAPNYAQDQKAAYALQVLTFILGEGATSYLYNALVHEQKIATWVRVGYDPQTRGPTILVIAAQPSPGKSLKELERAINKTIKDFLRHKITSEEVESAKRRMLATLDYAKDPAFAGTYELGYAVSIGRQLADVEAWPERIEAVQLQEVQAIAAKILSNQQHVTSLLIPDVTLQAARKKEQG